MARQEMKTMCSDTTDSILKGNKSEDLLYFSWDRLNEELLAIAPTLTSLLVECTKTRGQI